MSGETRNPNLDRVGLLTSPDYFFWGYKGAMAYFVNMNRDLYQKSIFCDGRIHARNNEVITMPLVQLLERFELQQFAAPKLNYIFHMAHGGSTLLSRALDIPGTNIVYREPAALRQLGVSAAEEQFGQDPPSIWQRVFRLSTTLLGKSYSNSERVIIKANVPVNFIIPELLAVNPHTRGIILFATLEDYLLSVLKSPGHRSWLRNVIDEVGNSVDLMLGLNPSDRGTLSDAEAAAAMWMTQIRLYANALQSNANLRSLDGEVFYSKPKQVLLKACEFYRMRVKEKKLEAIVNSPLFTHYSKDPQKTFDNELRLHNKETLRQQIRDELVQAKRWTEDRLATCDLPASLPKPLTPHLTKLLN